MAMLWNLLKSHFSSDMSRVRLNGTVVELICDGYIYASITLVCVSGPCLVTSSVTDQLSRYFPTARRRGGIIS